MLDEPVDFTRDGGVASCHAPSDDNVQAGIIYAIIKRIIPLRQLQARFTNLCRIIIKAKAKAKAKASWRRLDMAWHSA